MPPTERCCGRHAIADEAHQLGKNALRTTMWGPSGVPIWNSPTVDLKRNVLYAASFSNGTTEILWSSRVLIYGYVWNFLAVHWVKVRRAALCFVEKHPDATVEIRHGTFIHYQMHVFVKLCGLSDDGN